MKTWKKTLLAVGTIATIGLYELNSRIFGGREGRLRKALFYTSLGTFALYSTYSEEIDAYFENTKQRKEQYVKQIDSLQNVINEQYKIINTLDSLYLNLRDK